MNADSKFLNSLNLMSPVFTLKSGPSTASVLETHIEDQVDFADVILAAVNKFGCPINVDVFRHSLPSLEAHTVRKPERKATRGRARTPMVSVIGSDSEDGIMDAADDVLVLTATHSRNRLVAIRMCRYRYQRVPRILMQVLTVILPRYTKMAKFVIKDCLIDKYTIPELKNILCVTNITEVSLDSSFLPEGNYDVLLLQATSLQNLSLKRCNINDEVCKRIASRLHFPQPAETTLAILNLSSNQIADKGAKSIGKALRNNRHLRYLNIADNLITDDGAKYILDALQEFPLTADEVYHARAQRMKYLRHFLEIHNKSIPDLKNNSLHTNKSSSELRRKSSSIASYSTIKSKVSLKTEKRKSSLDESIGKSKIELIALDTVGPFVHPFQKSYVITKDGHSHCKGNFSLCCLNLAYNHLMVPSLQKLLDVLEYQKEHRNGNLGGLIKVVVEGNLLPIHCIELDNINVMFREMTRRFTRGKNSKVF